MKNGQIIRPKVKRVCQNCGKEFFKNKFYFNCNKGLFCNRKCASEFRIGKIIPVPEKEQKRRTEYMINYNKTHIRSGKDCNLWKGGITPINKKIRHSMGFNLWRIAVFKRDNWTCIWCGARSKKGKAVILEADHIKPFALYPELRFAIDNGRTLCKECHKTTETYGGKIFYKKLISAEK